MPHLWAKDLGVKDAIPAQRRSLLLEKSQKNLCNEAEREAPDTQLHYVFCECVLWLIVVCGTIVGTKGICSQQQHLTRQRDNHEYHFSCLLCVLPEHLVLQTLFCIQYHHVERTIIQREGQEVHHQRKVQHVTVQLGDANLEGESGSVKM